MNPRLADCVLSATTLITVDSQTYNYHAKTGTLTNVTRISPLSIYEVDKPNTLTIPVIHELVMYNYSMTEKTYEHEFHYERISSSKRGLTPLGSFIFRNSE